MNCLRAGKLKTSAKLGSTGLLSLLLVLLCVNFKTTAATCVVPVQGLVGWWPGEGSAGDIIGTNNGILQGGATAVGVGMVGQAFTFNGTNSFVQIPDSPVLRPTNLTIEGWVLFNSLNTPGLGSSPAGDQYIVFKQNSRRKSFEGYDLSKTRVGGIDVFRFLVTSSSGVERQLLSATPINTGVWYHVAAVRGPNFTQIYVNGQLERQTNVSFPQNYGTLPLYFGTSGQSYLDHKLSGRLDEVSLYNRALTSNEVAAIYAAGAAGKCKSGISITSQPQNQTVVAGGNALFTVVASGSPPLNYQWQFGNAPIAGATGTSLSISNAQPSDGGSYSVVVTNASVTVTSSTAVLTVVAPPQITLSPQSATNLAGSIAVFSATAIGSTPLAYQWRLNGTNLSNSARISGATTASLTISNVQLSDAGAYTLRVTNAGGAVTSDVAALTVTSPPLITSQPVGQTVLVGANASLNVAAAGTAPLSYQWLKQGFPLADGGNISGAATASLSLTNVQTGDSGNYQVVATNAYGATNSVVAVLNVNPAPIPPSITLPPTNQTVGIGSNAIFTVTAAGTSPLSYQWRKNGINLSNGGNISGATTTALILTSAQPGDAGNYSVFVTNIGGSITSPVASLSVTGSLPISGTFSNPASISILDVSPASPYPSAINVSGISGTLTKLTVTLNQLSHTYPDDIDILLVGPGGQKTLLMSDCGGALGVTNVILNFDDAAAAGLPDSTQIVSGTFKPSNFDTSDTFVAPAPPGPYSASPLSLFNGTNPNGAWALYVVDDGPQDVGTIAGGWSLTVSTAPPPPTNNPPTISDVPNQATTTNTATPLIPFIVGDVETAASNLVVTGISSNPVLVPNTNIVFFGTDSNRSVRITPAPGQSGTATIMLTVTDGGGAFASDSFVLTVVGGGGGSGSGIFSSTAVITIPDHGIATPYPSSITLSGVTGAVAKVTLTLYGLSHTYPDDIDALLVGPTGQSVLFMSDVGGALGVNNVTLTFDDAAAASLPDSAQIVSGTYKPTNIGTGDAFSGPAPQGPYGATMSVFNGTAAAGVWSLYIVDDETNDMGSVAGGWSLTLQTTNTPVNPPNDAFASAQSISGTSGSVNGTTVNATKQSGEPNHAGNAGGASVWYNWTAPSSSPVTFDTALSGFDTLLAAYTGSAVGSLTQIAANADISTNNNKSRLTFTPVAGTVYHIAVDGANGAVGNLTLRWVQASVGLPDLAIIGSAVNPRITTETFAASSCAVMEGLIQAGTRTLIRFDTQTANQGNADLFFGNPANNPLFVWAPCHAHYHFQNYMAYRLRDASGNIAAVGLKVGFCILDVFRWSSSAPNNAKYNCSNQGIQVGWGDLYDSSLDGQWIDITGLPNGNYTLELEANPLGIIQESNYGNNVTQVAISVGNPTAPPLNDNFASAETLLGGFASEVGANTNATKEAGEPNHAGNAGGHSVWYQWTAPSTKAVTIDTIGSSFNTLLAVYTGSSVSALTPISSNDDIGSGQSQSRVTFNATAGTVYRIAVDGFGGAVGSIVITLDQTLQNDNFANCQFIGGVSGYVYGANIGATKEPGEPNHAGNPGGQSVWYCWTAPIGGTVTFDTIGSSYNTLLAVYVGNSVDALTPIASNDDIDPVSGNLQSRVTFSAAGLTMYHVAIDGFNGDSGDHTLHWNLTSGQTLLGVANGQTLVGVVNNAGIPVMIGAVLSSSFLPEGEFRLSIKGQPQQLYRIERSCDLVHWLPLVPTMADDSGAAFFTDKSSTHSGASEEAICGQGVVGFKSSGSGRFYRAVVIGKNP